MCFLGVLVSYLTIAKRERDREREKCETDKEGGAEVGGRETQREM